MDEGGDGEWRRVSEDRSEGSEQNAINLVTYLIVFHERRVTAQWVCDEVTVFTEEMFPFSFRRNRTVNKHILAYGEQRSHYPRVEGPRIWVLLAEQPHIRLRTLHHNYHIRIMIDSLFIIGEDKQIIIEKHWKSIVERSVLEPFYVSLKSCVSSSVGIQWDLGYFRRMFPPSLKTVITFFSW